MAKVVHLKRDEVKNACANLEKLLAQEPDAQEEIKEFERLTKAEKTRRDKQFAERKAPIQRTVGERPLFSLSPIAPGAWCGQQLPWRGLCGLS